MPDPRPERPQDDAVGLDRQPSDRELLAARHRAGLPEIPGVSYRCPPAPQPRRVVQIHSQRLTSDVLERLSASIFNAGALLGTIGRRIRAGEQPGAQPS